MSTMPRAQGRSGRLLRQVRAGMAVYDRHRALVGTVAAVHLAAGGQRPAGGALAGGAVEIEGGERAASCYAGGGQIATVDGERVLLNVGRDYLLRR
jgi:hypothetical protein